MTDAETLRRPAPAAPAIPSPRPSAPLGRMGGLVVRLAAHDAEIDAALRLRHAVFVEECGADRTGREDGREADPLDAVCDHLLVLDGAMVVGTYRLLRGEVAARNGGHYSAAEFDLGPLLARHAGRRFLELGRSCTLPAYRDRRTIELLWQGVWAYALRHGCDVMFGCASFPGTDPEPHADALGYLARHAATAPEWSARALRDAIPLARFADRAAPPRRALAALPPLVKGYVRLGGAFGPDLVVDHDFNCLDALLMLPREALSPRYVAHYGADASRFT